MNPNATEILTTRYDPHPTPVPPEALEVISDVMIAASSRTDEYPAYGEASVARASRRASKAETYFRLITESQASGTNRSQYLRPPTAEEMQVLRLFREGLRLFQIADRMNLTRHKVRRMFRNAARYAPEPEPQYAGLSEVYHAETHPHIYRKPVHCSDEPCARLGHCKYALRGR